MEQVALNRHVRKIFKSDFCDEKFKRGYRIGQQQQIEQIIGLIFFITNFYKTTTLISRVFKLTKRLEVCQHQVFVLSFLIIQSFTRIGVIRAIGKR